MSEIKSRNILIADDEKDIAQVLQMVFEKAGYNVKIVDNGKKALEEVEKQKPDLIISDILMPILNGLKLCEILKSDTKHANIPIILLTAVYRQEQHIEIGFKHGADAYFSKPFNAERVLEVGKKLMNQAAP